MILNLIKFGIFVVGLCHTWVSIRLLLEGMCILIEGMTVLLQDRKQHVKPENKQNLKT